MLKCLYEDEHLLVAVKPAGYESQESGTFSKDMVGEIRNYLYHGQQIPYVGVVHRLDKPVKGVMVYAKTQKAAAVLSKQVQHSPSATGDKFSGAMEKWYYALVWNAKGNVKENVLPLKGELRDWLLFRRKENKSYVVPESETAKEKASLNRNKTAGKKRQEDCKLAVLQYEAAPLTAYEGFALELAALKERGAIPEQDLLLLKIQLQTGRHHQIRVQLSNAGFPVVGDSRYGTDLPEHVQRIGVGMPLCLCAYHLSFLHPVTGKRMTFEI